MTPDQEGKLGKAICDRTPTRYQPMQLPDNWEQEIEWDEERILWNFRGVDRRVGRALRIPVIITYDGQEYRDWLLVGFEGSPGY